VTNQGTPYHYVHLPNQASNQVRTNRNLTVLFNNKVINVLEALLISVHINILTIIY